MINQKIIILIISIIIFNFVCYRSKNQTEYMTNKLSINDKLQYPIYWINLDRSKDRYNSIINQFHKYNIKNHKRINAINGKNLESYNYIIPENKRTNNELACTISHVKAILQAYTDNTDYALIMEDDICLALVDKWSTSMNEIIKNAPSDWEILQLSVSPPKIIKLLHNINSNYTPWKQGYYSCLCYIINKKGMHKIKKRTVINNRLQLPNNCNLVADDFIYKTCHTYTYTYPLFVFSANNSIIMNNRTINYLQRIKQLILSYYNMTDIEC
jgi:GR25 family glycosyltransferase involved in LPS biosynthesis